MKQGLNYEEQVEVFNGLIELDSQLSTLISSKEKRDLLKDADVNGIFGTIAKNIRRLKASIKETDELRKELHEKFCEKDGKGEPVQHKKNRKDDKGNSEDYFQAEITDPAKAGLFEKELRDLLKKKEEVDLHTLSFTKVNKLEINGRTIAMLMDTVLVDETETKNE